MVGEIEMGFLAATAIVTYHDACLARDDWPPSESVQQTVLEQSAFNVWMAENHRHNGLLWAQEDLARRRRVSDAEIAGNKRAIDQHNQARNDAIERMDEMLLLALGLVTPESAQSSAPVVQAAADARLNSETAGSMVDRMSILALKIHAMRLQMVRPEETLAFRESCQTKHKRLLAQRVDLAGCFDQLMQDARTGKAWFQIYRQFKMYNDARMNPALQAESATKTL